MKKNLKVFIVFIASMSILFSACKSKPEAKPVKKPKAQVEKQGPSQAELDVAREKEALLAELERLQAEDGKLHKARTRAISLGADKKYAEEFTVAENLLESAKVDVESENLNDAVAKLNEAINRYDTLSNLMLAAQMKAEIEENNFSRYATDDFEEAEKMLENTLANYELDYKMAKESSDNALEAYGKVINQGYYEFAKTARESALVAKSDCDSIKVARSRSEDYNFAVRLFAVGKTDVDNNEYKKAYEAFSGAAKKFKTLYDNVSVRRAEAEIAIAEAAKKQQESSELALEADQESPLIEAVDGFTDGDLELEDKSSPLPTESGEPTTEEIEVIENAENNVDDNAESDSDTEENIIDEIEELETEELPVELSEEDMDLANSEESEIEEVEIENPNTETEMEEVEIDESDISNSEIEIDEAEDPNSEEGEE